MCTNRGHQRLENGVAVFAPGFKCQPLEIKITNN
jgi:hypothetical protein